jgi:hypothetical protein
MPDMSRSPSLIDTAPSSGTREQENHILGLSKPHDVEAPRLEKSLSTDPLQQEDPFPEGGLQAWLVVFGAWAGL